MSKIRKLIAISLVVLFLVTVTAGAVSAKKVPLKTASNSGTLNDDKVTMKSNSALFYKPDSCHKIAIKDSTGRVTINYKCY